MKKEFTLPIIIGLVNGTYSSIFLAAPLRNVLINRAGSKNKSKASRA